MPMDDAQTIAHGYLLCKGITEGIYSAREA
jgi:hypothetical protein